MSQNNHHSRWSIDRRIPLAVIIALLLQIVGVVIWATQLNARVNVIEQQTMTSANLNEKFARLEERLGYMKQDLEALKRQMNHLTDRLLK